MGRSDPATEAVAKPPQEASAREEEILQAAFDVFTEKGFHGATMLDVASRAYASKARCMRVTQARRRCSKR